LFLNYKSLEQVADDEVRTCLEPLIKAENDRLLLWQLRRNREEENNLMKNVPGWETGTWFGEPVYKTNKNLDTWILPNRYEVYAHTRPLALTEITMLDQKSL
jgi:NADH dehydrogenase (ubiquinone) 1 alpha subcomplex subunit 13